MAGHSKWNNIKNRKGAQDAKRGKLFSQLSKNIKIAVKEGKSDDPKSNPALRLAMDKARAANMPKDKIQKAIDRGMGKSSAGQLQEILYEGYGPQGVGFLVAAVTDNTQRTGSEIKYIFSRNNGSIGGPGSVSYMFERSEDGNEYVPTMPMQIDDPKLQEQLEAMADAFRENDDVEDVYMSGVWEVAEE